MTNMMTNEERAKQIVAIAGGHELDCLDWLDDGDVLDTDTIAALVSDWRKADCEYSA